VFSLFRQTHRLKHGLRRKVTRLSVPSPECTYEKPYFHGVVRHYYFQHYKGDSVFRQEGGRFICVKCGRDYGYDVNTVEHYYREHVSGGKLYDVIPLNHFFDKGETKQEEKKKRKGKRQQTGLDSFRRALSSLTGVTSWKSLRLPTRVDNQFS